MTFRNQTREQLTALIGKRSIDLTTYRTLFQTADTWPLHNNADPLNGWSLREIESSPSGPASADIYGKLFYYLRAQIQEFLLRLSDLEVCFRLFQVNAADLPDHLESDSFSRIEVRMYLEGYILTS